MEPQPREGEQDGTQRWFAGLPSVGVIPPEALTDAHRTVARRALHRERRNRALLGVGSVACLVALVVIVRVPALLCPALPLLLLLAGFGPGWCARAWKRRSLAGWVDERGIHGTVERFEGHTPAASLREFLGQLGPENQVVMDGRGPRFLRVDVLTEVGLVLSMAEQHPPRTSAAPKPLVDVAPGGLHYSSIQTTSDRLAGTEQGATRPLAANERVELPDLARHDASWRTLLPTTPALLPVVYLSRSLFGGIGMWVAILLSLLAATVIVVSDGLAVRRRRRLVDAAMSVSTVLGGVNREGEQVEVLLPDKLLWTVSGRPAPDRLRDRSRALSEDAHTPTTF